MTGAASSRAIAVRNGATAALAPAAFLAVDPAGWYPFGPLKWFLVSVLVLTAAAAATAARATHEPWPTSAALDRAGLVLVGAMVGASFVGLDPLYAWTGTPERHAGVLLWVLCFLALRVGQATTIDGPLSVALVGAGLGVGGAATAEALGWEPAVLDVGSRLTGLMGSSAYLGAVAALLLPVLVGVSVGSRSTGLRIAAGVGAGGLAVALVGSGARAAWVGVSVAVVVTAWARRSTIGHHPGLAAGLVAGAAIVLGAVLVLSPAASRLTALADEGAPGGRGRLDEWRVATAVLAGHPLTGVGPEGYRIAFAEGVDAAYEERHGRDPLPDRAHSGPLDVALAGGPVALGAWAVLWAVVGRSAWRALRSGGPRQVGLAAGIVAHWVGQLFLFPLAELEPVVWLLAGVLVASQARPGELRSIRTRRWSGAVAPVLAVGVVVAVVAGGLAVAADRAADRAATTGSLTDAETATRLRPDVVRYHLLLARLRVDQGEGLLAALDATDDALAVSPRDPIARLAKARYLVERALATEVPAHAAEARSYLRELLADDPLDTRARALVAVLDASGG